MSIFHFCLNPKLIKLKEDEKLLKLFSFFFPHNLRVFLKHKVFLMHYFHHRHIYKDEDGDYMIYILRII